MKAFTPSENKIESLTTTLTFTEEECARLDQEIYELFRKFDDLHKSLGIK